jgi:hypothetical protein
MRGFLILVVAIGAFWAIDVLAFDSRYSNAVWRETKYQAQQFNYEVKRWLNRGNR